MIDPAGAEAATPLTGITAANLDFLFNPDREAVDEEHTAYGLAVYQPDPDTTFAVVTQEGTTTIATAEIVTDGAAFGYTDVQHLDLPAEFELSDGTTWVPCEEPDVLPQLEGVSVDQRNGVLYATQEDVGLWRIQLPLGSSEPELVDRVADFGIEDTYDEESEECVPVDENAEGFVDEERDATNFSYIDWHEVANASICMRAPTPATIRASADSDRVSETFRGARTRNGPDADHRVEAIPASHR